MYKQTLLSLSYTTEHTKSIVRESLQMHFKVAVMEQVIQSRVSGYCSRIEQLPVWLPCTINLSLPTLFSAWLQPGQPLCG